MALLIALILYPVFLLIIIIWILLKKQTYRDLFFKDMYPANYDAVARRLKILEIIHPNTTGIYRKKIISYLKQYSRINNTISLRLEYFFQAAYFDNFRDKLIAYKTACLQTKLFILVILVMSNIIIALLSYEFMDFSYDHTFFEFYLIYSLALAPVAIVITLVQILFLGVVLSFFNLFDKSGKIRRFSVHLDEMVKALKPGGRKAEVGLMSTDELERYWIF